MGAALIVVTLGLAIALTWTALRLQASRRADYIRVYHFPPGLIEKLQQRRPGLKTKDAQLVARALRQFFLAHLKSGRKFVSMPSQITDDLWHEFILYTRHYDEFCRRAFGRFLHHTPAVVLGKERRSNSGLRRTWWYCCREENINPSRPTRLPLLFALDGKLELPDGFLYSTRCEVLRRNGQGDIYCAGDFSSDSYDGGTSGFGDAASSGSSSSHQGSSSADHAHAYSGEGASSSDGSGSSDGGGSSCGGGCGGSSSD